MLVEGRLGLNAPPGTSHQPPPPGNLNNQCLPNFITVSLTPTLAGHLCKDRWPFYHFQIGNSNLISTDLLKSRFLKEFWPKIFNIQQIKFNILMILFEVILGQKFRKKSEFGKSKWFSQKTPVLKPNLRENFEIYIFIGRNQLLRSGKNFS